MVKTLLILFVSHSLLALIYVFALVHSVLQRLFTRARYES